MGGKKSSVDALSTCQGVGSAWGFGEVLTLSPSALVACAGWRQEWSNEGFPKAPQGSSSQTPPNQGDDGECSSCPAPQPCLRLPQSCCCWGEPRDGEEPSCSFPTLTWSDSSPHHPVPKFPDCTQAFNLFTGCYFCASFFCWLFRAAEPAALQGAAAPSPTAEQQTGMRAGNGDAQGSHQGSVTAQIARTRTPSHPGGLRSLF